MAASRETHLEFWNFLTGALARDPENLIGALELGRDTVAGSLLEHVVERVLAEVRDGAALSDALTGKDEFTETVQTMVRVGEAGGVLPVSATRIGVAIGDGSFRIPGESPLPENDPERMWRAFSRMLSSGVPLPTVLELLDDELSSAELRGALGAISQALADGRTFGDALTDHADLFGASVVGAVRAAEERGDLDAIAFEIADRLAEGRLDLSSDQVDPGSGDVSAETCVRNLIESALDDGISDIHLEPTEDGRGRIRQRRGGVLTDAAAPPDGLFPRIVGRLKLKGGMDIAEQRRPQQGRIVGIERGGRIFDLRVATVVTDLGERLTVRFLDRATATIPLERLGLLDGDLEALRGLTNLPHGLVMVAGPAGSGKTTVLYSMIHEIDRLARCVVTIEDPVHYRLRGTSQIPCRRDLGLPPAKAVRAAMRQDPDVIAIGELEDAETIREAMKAENTGHLVLTQMHAVGAAAAIRQLLDFGIEDFRINASLTAVVSLRLVKRLCPACRVATEVARSALPTAAAEFLDRAVDTTFYAPAGCPECSGTGFKGRVGTFEILVPDDAFRAAVRSDPDLTDLQSAVRASGMRPMLESGLALAATGATSVEEVCRAVGNGA
jgi:type II secretory ATPase GspE/PulE/Tfp pilus assembly ATPase PilB-like protein